MFLELLLRFQHVLGNSKTLSMLRFQHVLGTSKMLFMLSFQHVLGTSNTFFMLREHHVSSVSSRQRQTWRWHCWTTNVVCLGFRVATQFGQPCQLDQKVGKDHVCDLEWTGRANENLLLNEMEAGRGKNKTNLQIPIENEHVCVLKPQRNATFILTQSTKCCKGCKIWTWRHA